VVSALDDRREDVSDLDVSETSMEGLGVDGIAQRWIAFGDSGAGGVMATGAELGVASSLSSPESRSTDVPSTFSRTLTTDTECRWPLLLKQLSL
jgi:hypothetical protein